MPRHLPADMPTVTLDGGLVTSFVGASLVGSAMWVAIGYGVCWLAGWR